MTERPERTHSYLVALVDGGGTVPPELGAVRRLVERGHTVRVLAEDSMRSDVHATGAAYLPWTTAPNRASRRAEDDPYQDWECKNPLQLFRRVLERQFVGPAAAYAADVTEAIARDRPDLVICSFFAQGAMAAAEAAGIPFDVLFPNVYPLPARGMPPFGTGFRPATGPLGRLRDRAGVGLTVRLFDKGLPGLNAMRHELGLGPIPTFFDQTRRARRHLVLTSEHFDFPAQLPANARYVGAVLDDPTWSGSDWSAPPGDDPLVLVAMSSTFQDQASGLQRIIDALSELPVRALVTTGPALPLDTLRGTDAVAVVAAAPHSRVLEEAALVVTHGGHGTVVRALAAGVPMVVVPHGRDQADNAVRVTTRGAGLVVTRSAGAPKVAAAVRQILDEPSFRVNAGALGDAIRRDAASGALVAALEDVPTATDSSATC